MREICFPYQLDKDMYIVEQKKQFTIGTQSGYSDHCYMQWFHINRFEFGLKSEEHKYQYSKWNAQEYVNNS